MATIKIKQVRSRIGCPKNQKRTLDALGLRKIGCVVEHNDNPAIRGMIKKVKHLISIIEELPTELKADNHTKGLVGEQFVNKLASKAYLKYWCYPNPIDEDGDKKEICDLLISFFDTAIIISVKNYDNKGDYERYKRKVIEKSSNQLFGAERKLFGLNRDIRVSHPNRGDFIIKPAEYRHIHRITVNVGEQFEKYELIDTKENKGCINILNKETFEVITNELDTIKDLTEYLSIRENIFIENINKQIHCSEKDLLAFYLMNAREFPKECYNNSFEEWSKICIGKWEQYLSSSSVFLKKLADKKSYFIDELVKNDVLPLVDGELLAKELMTLSRFERRNIAANLFEIVKKYQCENDYFARRHTINDNNTMFLFVYYPPNKTEAEKDELLKITQEIYAYKFHPNKIILLAATNQLKQWKFSLFETQNTDPTNEQQEYYDKLIEYFGWFKSIDEYHKENKEYPDETDD
jgi:ribosomal protein L30